jgi:hypothetical protein
MIKATDAKAKTEAYHAHNESAILTMLETIDATIIYHAAHGDTNATYQPPIKLESGMIEAVLHILRSHGYVVEYRNRGFFMIRW